MKKKENKNCKLIYFLGGILFLLILVQLLISHWLATKGEIISLNEQKASELEKENAILRAEINQMGSLSKISSQAGQLGFVKSTHILYFTPEIPIAFK